MGKYNIRNPYGRFATPAERRLISENNFLLRTEGCLVQKQLKRLKYLKKQNLLLACVVFILVLIIVLLYYYFTIYNHA